MSVIGNYKPFGCKLAHKTKIVAKSVNTVQLFLGEPDAGLYVLLIQIYFERRNSD